MVSVLVFALFGAVAAQQRTIVQTAQAVPELSTLVSILTTPAYAPILAALSGPGPFTVFAPTNDAFRAAGIDVSNTALVTAALQNHVIAAKILSTDLQEGANIANTLLSNPDFVNTGANSALNVERFLENVRVSFGISYRRNETSDVIQANVQCSNGVVHIVNRVILFPSTVPVAVRDAGFNFLLEAVVKAGLVDAVNNTRGITIFAPFNEAFAAANWESLTVEQLKSVLTLHVVPAVAYSTTLVNDQKLTTLNGQVLTVRKTLEGIFLVNSAGAVVAAVRVPNILVKNGVIHGIDKVILPVA